jgi:hypothetical protein
MPTVASLEALERAAAEFEIGDTRLVIEPPALTEARRSLESSGLLLLGEVHGVRENPLVIRALMVALRVTGLALEWNDQLTPVIGGYLAGRPLADDMALWSGDGRITTGHLAVLPLGANIARQRPGVRSIRIKYGAGRFYNLEPRRFRPRVNVGRSQARLRQQRGHLVLDLPRPTEATVPQRPREPGRSRPRV